MWRSSLTGCLNRSSALGAGYGCREIRSGSKTCNFSGITGSYLRASTTSPFLAFSFTLKVFHFSSGSTVIGDAGNGDGDDGRLVGKGDAISSSEAKKLMRLVDVQALKLKLGMDRKEVIGYSELLKACQGMGVARSLDEAAAFARVLDEAAVVLLVGDKVYLHPDKVIDLVRTKVTEPLALTAEDDPRKEELKRKELKNLLEKKEEIDQLAHRHVRCILWSGLGIAVTLVGIFFRLTFWEFSWDVMEPIAFFSTTTGLVIGYAYFLFTSKDPTYQDMMKRLFLSRQRKLFKKHNFDADRFKELQAICRSPLDSLASNKKKIEEGLLVEDA
ncbi:hypothetical protein Dimus_020627 [Dionaea muscipula]